MMYGFAIKVRVALIVLRIYVITILGTTVEASEEPEHIMLTKTVYPGVPMEIYCNASYPFIQLFRDGQTIQVIDYDLELPRLGMEVRNVTQIGNTVFFSIIHVNWNPQNHHPGDSITAECIEVSPSITTLFLLMLSYKSKLPPPKDVQITNDTKSGIHMVKWMEPLFNSSSIAQYFINNITLSYILFFTSMVEEGANFTRGTKNTSYELTEITEYCGGLDYLIEVSASCDAGGNGEKSPALPYEKLIENPECQNYSNIRLTTTTVTSEHHHEGFATTMQPVATNSNIISNDHNNQDENAFPEIGIIGVGVAISVVVVLGLMISITMFMCICLKRNHKTMEKDDGTAFMATPKQPPVYEEVAHDYCRGEKFKITGNSSYEIVTKMHQS